MQPVEEHQGNLITQPDRQSAAKRNVFADCRDVSLSSAEPVVDDEQVTQQHETQEDMTMQAQDDQNVAQGLNTDGNSSITPIDGDHQEHNFSQSLPQPTQGFVRDSFQSTAAHHTPLPTQSFVVDSYQTVAGDPNAMDIDDEEIPGKEIQGMPLSPYVDVNLQRIIDCGGDVRNAMDTAVESVEPKEMGDHPAQGNGEASDELVQDSIIDKTAVEESEMPDVQDRVELSQCQEAPRYMQDAEDTVVAAPSRQVPLQHPQPRRRSFNIQITEPQMEVEAQPGKHATKPLPTRPSAKLVRTRTAEPQVSASTEESNTPKRVVHRSTLSSRSGRMLPPRTVSREKAPMEVDVDVPVAERETLPNERRIDRVVATEREGHSKRNVPEVLPQTEPQGQKTPLIRDSQPPRHQDAKDKTSTTIRTEVHSTKTIGNSETSRKSLKPTGGDPTGNARFQQKLQQSTGRTGLSAEQLAAARAAALPHVERSLNNAINPPFVAPSKEQQQAFLTQILSRSSSPLNARALKGHPRATLVRERREQAIQTPRRELAIQTPRREEAIQTPRLEEAIQTPQLPPRTPQVQIPGDGSQDERLALGLIMRAKDRETEILKLKLEIQKLEQQNESLERLNAGLVEEKGEALRQNAQILQDKKAAIGKAKDLIIASQKT